MSAHNILVCSLIIAFLSIFYFYSTSFQVWKNLLSLSLNLDNVGYVFPFSWVHCHNLWLHIVKFIFTTNSFIWWEVSTELQPQKPFLRFRCSPNPLRHYAWKWIPWNIACQPAWGKFCLPTKPLVIQYNLQTRMQVWVKVIHVSARLFCTQVNSTFCGFSLPHPWS